eukprot:UN30800
MFVVHNNPYSNYDPNNDPSNMIIQNPNNNNTSNTHNNINHNHTNDGYYNYTPQYPFIFHPTQYQQVPMNSMSVPLISWYHQNNPQHNEYNEYNNISSKKNDVSGDINSTSNSQQQQNSNSVRNDARINKINTEKIMNIENCHNNINKIHKKSQLIYLVKQLQQHKGDLWGNYLKTHQMTEKNPAAYDVHFLKHFLILSSQSRQIVRTKMIKFFNAIRLLSKTSLTYKDLVLLSQCHSDYKELTNFLGFKFKKTSSNYPIVALDSEMCVTNSSRLSLLRLSIVNVLDGKVILDTWVAPPEPIIDFKTEITGMDEKGSKT